MNSYITRLYTYNLCSCEVGLPAPFLHVVRCPNSMVEKPGNEATQYPYISHSGGWVGGLCTLFILYH